MIDLKHILKGNILILCIGNIERGDDGAGPYLASLIKEKSLHEVIDAGMTPENYTGLIRRSNPDSIIIVDVIYFEGEPGEIRIFSGEDLRSGKISTHDVSPKLLIDYLHSSTDSEIHIIGIKPKSNKLGEGLSKEVKEAVEELSLFFL